MKQLLFLALLVAAGWYGWTHYQGLFQRRPSHQAVIVNQTGQELDRIRLKVDGQTLVKETLAAGETAWLPFRVNRDSAFELVWQIRGEDRTWSGGMVSAGPMAQSHSFTSGEDNQVMYRAEAK